MDARRSAGQFRDQHALRREPPASRISASRPRTRPNSPRSTSASPAPSGRSSRKRRRPAVTPNPTSNGSPTRRGCHWETFFTYGESTTYGVSDCAAAAGAGHRRGRAAAAAGRPLAQPAPRAQSRAPRLLRRLRAADERRGLPRPLSLHRQLGAEHPGRGAAQALGKGPVRGVQRRQLSQGRGASAGARPARAAASADRGAAQQELGRVRAARARRSWISSLPSATRRRARSARSGRAIR